MEENIRSHNIVMENRKKASLSGVCEVLSFSDDIIRMDTVLGRLTIKGDNMRIDRFSAETGDLDMIGDILGMVYEGNSKKTSMKGRLFK